MKSPDNEELINAMMDAHKLLKKLLQGVARNDVKREAG